MEREGKPTVRAGSPAENISRGFRAVGLFSGIGGLESGLHRSGHPTVLMAENDTAACAVLRRRFPGVENEGE